MRLRHIEIFHAVYVTGSVSGGARALNVSQPTVSKILKHAEDQIGFKLFDRVGGRLNPTDRGNKLFAKIEPLFEKLKEFDRFAVHLANERTGRLKFAMTPAFGLEVAPSAIASFSKDNPDVTIEAETLHASQLIKAILANEIDMGMVFDAPTSPGLDKKTIGTTKFICICSKQEAGLISGKPFGPVRIKDLKHLPLITLNPKSVLGQVLNLKITEAFDGPINPQITVETYHLAKRLVKQQAGIAIIDAITAFSGDITDLNFFPLADTADINVDIVSRTPQPRVKIKSDFMRELERSLAAFNHKIAKKLRI